MRPLGPLPDTLCRSTPASCARRRIAGEVATRPRCAATCAPPAAPFEAGRAAPDPTPPVPAAGAEPRAATPACAPPLAAPACAEGSPVAAAAGAAPAPVSNTINADPTGTISQ